VYRVAPSCACGQQLVANSFLVMRLFFALWPDAGTRDSLAAIAAGLPAGCGRRVDRDALHLTLCFLGNVGEDVRDCLLRGAGAIRTPGFALTLDRLGWFRRARVVWLAPERAPEELSRLVRDVDAVVGACGLTPDNNRPYQPHLTLSRKAVRPAKSRDTEPIHWNIRDFCLVQSFTHDTGPEYRILQRWGLRPA